MTLDDPTFIIQIVYGVITLPLYIATFVAILRTKARNGTFFRWYVASGIVNIISYLNKFFVIRLPLYTCGQCALSPYYTDRIYWWLPISFFVHWHTVLLQPLFSVAISLDRFIVLILKITFWKRWHLYFIAILFFVPIIFTSSLIGANPYYEYLPMGDNFRISTAEDLESLYDSLILIMTACTIIGAGLNLAVFLYFFMGKIKVQGVQRAIEIKLFCNSVIEIWTQICTTGAILFQRIFLSPDSLYYNMSRIPLLFTGDIMTLLPPFVIILTCTDIRHYLLPFLRKQPGVPTLIPSHHSHSVPIHHSTNPSCH